MPQAAAQTCTCPTGYVPWPNCTCSTYPGACTCAGPTPLPAPPTLPRSRASCGATCIGSGGGCNPDTPCCGGLTCLAGTCSACIGVGGGCTAGGTPCCGNSTITGNCVSGTCSDCGADGDYCTTNGACCGGSCCGACAGSPYGPGNGVCCSPPSVCLTFLTTLLTSATVCVAPK